MERSIQIPTKRASISANIANQDAILNERGEYEPYRRRIALMSAGDPASGSDLGVHVNEIVLDQSPPQMRFEPDSPYADANGYVGYPNVNTVNEQIDAMIAARSYEANISAVEAAKSMMAAALQLLS